MPEFLTWPSLRLRRREETSGDAELCTFCKAILDGWSRAFSKDWTDNATFRHYRTLVELEKSAATCRLCSQFWMSHMANAEDTLGKYRQRRLVPRGVFAFTSNAFNGPTVRHDCPTLRMVFFDRGVDDFRLHTEPAFSLRLDVDVVRAVRPARRAFPNTTREAMEVAAKWLAQCRKSHKQCITHGSSFRPTRLVTTTSDSVRLCLAAGLPKSPQYATLSHCWGKVKFLTLSKENFDQFRGAIPSQAMNKTFRESIEIASALGFGYIWIDSLCIVQDDADDWARESAKMSSVYGHSGLNIAASGAPDGTHGCFFERPPTWRCQVFSRRKDQNGVDCVPGGMYHNRMAQMPLAKRGWAFQERLLPTRTIHFTTDEVYWECHTHTACETFPDGFPTCLTYSSSFFQKAPVSLSMWTWIVERYSGFELTYPHDKLVAISGLARAIQAQTGDQYVAGLWRTNLEPQLCWSTVSSMTSTRAVPHRAPTWSWASLDGPVNAYTAIEHFPESPKPIPIWIRVLDVVETPAPSSQADHHSGGHPLGATSTAKLSLSITHLALATFDIDSDEEDDRQTITLGSRAFECAISFDCPSDDAHHPPNYHLHTAFVLPICGTSATTVHGLILERAGAGTKKGTYRRLGSWRHARSRMNMYTFAGFEEILRGVGPLGDECFVDVRVDGEGEVRRVIELV